ncbi:MAG TPA: cyclic nucleotide-binding domain-containing protein [Anaeromyxobacteraceae bacterium]|nr:cyclic nucleotide-binding domain-containing protein [Anaeromyxobacteraceae bacterium]
MASEPREVFGDLATTAFVESCVLFRSLDPAERQDLVRLARVVSFTGGEMVSPAGDDGFFMVLDGSMAALVERGGASVEVAVLERGAVFGEGRVLGAGVPAALAGRSDGAAVVVPAPMVAALAGRHPKIQKFLDAVRGAREREAATKLAG